MTSKDIAEGYAAAAQFNGEEICVLLFPLVNRHDLEKHNLGKEQWAFFDDLDNARTKSRLQEVVEDCGIRADSKKM